MRQKQPEIFSSPCFLISLLILLLNDFVLKPQFHNQITGKLSDIFGLIVFVLFWQALFPAFKTHIYALTTILFTLWKSPFSQPFIGGWNNYAFFSIGRTVDYTDLAALFMLPIVYFCKFKPLPLLRQKWAAGVVAIIAVFAFTATSSSQPFSYNKEYYFSKSKKELIRQMSILPRNEVYGDFKRGEEFLVVFDSCNSRAEITVLERAGLAVVLLREMDYRCSENVKEETVRAFFEDEFIDKLRENPVEKSKVIEYISATKLNTDENSDEGPPLMKTPAPTNANNAK